MSTCKFTSSFMYFVLIFSECNAFDYFFWRGFEIGYQENWPLENCPRENCPQKIPPYENTPVESSSCENYPPEICVRENSSLLKFLLWENYPPWNPLPTYKSYKWKKKQNYNFFWLEESCAKQHPYQNNQFPLWYTDDLTENTGLRYLKSTNWKKAKNRQMTFTCTCPLYKLRRTKTRQSNYKIWEILETTK